MKIIPRPKFLQLPAGTVFMRYTPCVFTGLFIKGETVGTEFTCAPLIGAVAWGTSGDYFERCAMMAEGRSFPAHFEAYGLDMEFEDDAQQYGIYDAADVTALLVALRPGSGSVKEVHTLDGTWDGTYTFYINAARLHRVITGQLIILEKTAEKAWDLQGQRMSVSGVVSAAEKGVNIRWNDDGSFWTLQRDIDEHYTLTTLEGPAQLVRSDTIL